MASEGHSEATKLPIPSPAYESAGPMLSPPTSYVREYALPLRTEPPQQSDQPDDPDRRKRSTTRRRVAAVVVLAALLACVVAVILVLRYHPDQRVVVWVLAGLIGLLAIALLVILFPGCPSATLTCCPSPDMF